MLRLIGGCLPDFAGGPVTLHGNVTFFESKAIATYVDRTFRGQKFIPDDTLRLVVWCSRIHLSLQR